MQAQEVERYQVDPAASRVTVKVSSGGLLSAFGHNPTIEVRNCSGEAAFVFASLDQASVRFVARTDLFAVADDISQKDKLEMETTMKQEVLEISRYPEIVFASSSVSAAKVFDNRYALEIRGNLTLHGVTRPQTITCQATLDGDTVRGVGEFALRQTDFGIKLASVAGGVVKLKDEIQCSFDICARRRKQSDES